MIGYLRGQDGAILVTAITFPQSPSGPGAQNFYFCSVIVQISLPSLTLAHENEAW